MRSVKCPDLYFFDKTLILFKSLNIVNKLKKIQNNKQNIYTTTLNNDDDDDLTYLDDALNNINTSGGLSTSNTQNKSSTPINVLRNNNTQSHNTQSHNTSIDNINDDNISGSVAGSDIGNVLDLEEFSQSL